MDSSRSAPVHFFCTAPPHRSGAGGRADKITVHDGRWAYCPHDVRADGHEWTPTGGVPLAQLMAFGARAIDAAAGRGKPEPDK